MATDPLSDDLGLQLRRESTADQVAGALRDLILAGRLPPGTHLPEGPLSGRLGVSRNTVREATHILVSQGLVHREMHRGAYVAEIDADDVRDLFRVRRLVEGTAVREVAAGVDLAPLARAVDATAAAIEHGVAAEVANADLEFHRTLVGLLRSDRLGSLFDAVDAEMRLSVSLVGPDEHLKHTLRDQRAILAALRRGDGEQAAALLARHLDAGEKRLLRHLERA